jgi:hypothetical protein
MDDEYQIFETKLVNFSEKTQKYYNNITIFSCRGDECKFHANDFRGLHCKCCHGDVDKIEPKEIDVKLYIKYNNKSIIIFNCRGDGCDIHAVDGKGLHCQGCYGFIDLSENQSDE